MSPRGQPPNFNSFASRSLSTSSESESKYSSKTSFECEFCTKTYTKWKKFNKHKKRHYARRKFNCKICDRVLTSRPAWSYHMKSIHERCKDFKCFYCDKGFVTKQQLQAHIKNHKYVCHFCLKTFTAGYKLKEHKEIHKIFICNICNKGFFRNHRLQRHRDRMHPGVDGESSIKDESPSSIKGESRIKKEEIEPSCLEEEMSCDEEEHNEETLPPIMTEEEHDETDSEETLPPIPTEEECKYCRRIFASKDDLQHHWKLTGENLFICAHCLEFCEGDISFSLHQMQHKEEQIFTCTLCWKTFVSMDLLEDHFTTHAGPEV